MKSQSRRFKSANHPVIVQVSHGRLKEEPTLVLSCLYFWLFFFISFVTGCAIMFAITACVCIYLVGKTSNPRTKVDLATMSVTAVLIMSMAILIGLTIICSFCGICCGLRCMLRSQYVVTLLSVTVEFCAILYAWIRNDRKALGQFLHDMFTGLLTACRDNSQSNIGQTALKLMSLAQEGLHCCGRDGPNDYKDFSLTIPVSCKASGGSRAVWNVGCVSAAETWVVNNAGYIAFFLFLLFSSQMLVILFGQPLVCTVSDEDD